MASPRFEAILHGKGPAPLADGPFGMASVDRCWLRLLLVFAVTILLSVLPFKAPSVKPLLLSSVSTGSTLLVDSGPTWRDLASLPQMERGTPHGHLKVAKKPQRKSWGVDIDPSAGRAAVTGYEAEPDLRPPLLFSAQGTRSPPRQRLRAPPGSWDLV